jgi:hypothetical protein
MVDVCWKNIHIYYFLSNTFLDWDGLSHMSTIEQLFNPSKYDISRRTEQGI